MKPMVHKAWNYLLDGISGTYFIAGIINGQNIALFLGGIASIMAMINHYQQILDRKQKQKQNTDK